MEFYFPQRVHLGPGISQKLGLAAKGVGSRILLLADGTYEESKELGILTHSLERASVPYLVLTRNPRQNLADAQKEAVSMAQASRVDILASLGQADQLSLGRVAVTALSSERAMPYFEVPTGICYPLLLRPEAFLSTGHPSDARFVPFQSNAGHQAFLDPHMATGQTPKASVSALMEALFYGVEAFLHDRAGITEQSLLIGAIEVLWSTLGKIHADPANAEYRWLATQAGFNIVTACALGSRGTGLTFSFTLAGLAGLSTSVFGSLLLAPLLEFRAPRAGARLRVLARAVGYDEKDSDEESLGPRLAQEVRKFLNHFRLPLRLADYRLVATQITQAIDAVRGSDVARGGVLEPEQLPDFVQTIL